MTCSVHSPSLRRGCPLARFTGRTDPLSRGAGYTSSASYARRGKLVTTNGELRRPTSSRCTDGDATDPELKKKGGRSSSLQTGRVAQLREVLVAVQQVSHVRDEGKAGPH